MEASTVSCNKGAKGKTGKVSIKTKEGFVFKGVVRPPNEIVSMVGGDFFADFVANISLESQPDSIKGCGGYGVNIVGKQFPKGYTTGSTSLWESGVVEYNFVSDGTDSMKDAAFYVDAKVGYNQNEMAIIVKAMKKIEEQTCIRFKRINPQPGKPWLLIMREARGSTCLTEYINSNLKDKDIGNLGKVFYRYWSGSCFGGAYASKLGSGSPTFQVASSITIDDTESTVGLFVHEFLHNLGVGHTQKRPGKLRVFKFFLIILILDRDTYVTVNYNNIARNSWSQYDKCEGTECLTFGSPYDCSSIMHYRDYFFATGTGKTMTAKDPSTCSLSGYMTQLTAADITLLKVKHDRENGYHLTYSRKCIVTQLATI